MHLPHKHQQQMSGGGLCVHTSCSLLCWLPYRSRSSLRRCRRRRQPSCGELTKTNSVNI